MLLQVRELLYEGNWDDFEQDLRARLAGMPHVFDTIPDTPGMKATITRHLALIDRLRQAERNLGRALSCGE